MRQHRPGLREAATAALRASRLATRGAFACSTRTASSALARGAVACLVVSALHGCGSSSTAPSDNQFTQIQISPDSLSLTTGNSKSLVAQARTAAGSQVPNQTFYWSTSDSVVATVTQTGVVVAHEPGAAQISASAEGKSGFSRVFVVLPLAHTVTVTPAFDTIYASHPGETIKLTGSSYDAQGHLLPGHQLLWSTSSLLATVTSGMVTATNTGAGSVTITATSPDSGNPAGTASITVIGHTASVSVVPQLSWLSTSGSFFLPASEQLTPTVTDAFGHIVTGQRKLTWSSANTSVAVVSRTGLVTAVSTTGDASTQITARTSDGVSGSVTVNVFP
jgi:trimeric autotransporter adhesin